MAGGLSEPRGGSPPPSLLSPLPLVSWCPRPKAGVGVGEEGRRRKPGRKGPGSQSKERAGQVPACWGRMAAEAGSEPQGPGMDSFPPLLLPSPLISGPQVPTSHHTHLEATPTIFSPPAPHFLLSLLSWAQKDVGVSELRVGEGVRVGGRVRTFPSTPSGQHQPSPPGSRRPSYNIHEPHEYAMSSLWGGGLAGSAFPFSTP